MAEGAPSILPTQTNSRISHPAMHPLAPPTHHSHYYFDDGNLIILVEQTLFNIHRSTLTRHSRVFGDIFSLPLPKSIPGHRHVIEGSADDCPLHFEGISTIDFERLLWILYPPMFGVCKARTIEEWTSILHLSTRWEFDGIRSLAVREIELLDLSPVDKIVLSRQYDINSSWTLKAYTDLCERFKPITIHEARALGLEITVRISQLREQLRGTPRSASPMRRNSVSTRRVKAESSSSESIGQMLEEQHVRKLTAKACGLSDHARMVAEAFGLAISDHM